jgi:hypothetical protein
MQVRILEKDIHADFMLMKISFNAEFHEYYAFEFFCLRSPPHAFRLASFVYEISSE